MLCITDLSVSVNDTPVLDSLSFFSQEGQTHLFMGPNGSGKTTLAKTIIGDPCCSIKKGTMFFNDKNLAQYSPDERARFGIFMAFQDPVAVPGLTVFSFLKSACDALHGTQLDVCTFRDMAYAYADAINFDHAWFFRGLHEGFSGGQKKKLELLQLMLFRPALAILDEIDSGLDVDAVHTIKKACDISKKNNPSMITLFITHNPVVASVIDVDSVHIIKQGSIVRSGNKALIDTIKHDGYDAFTTAY